MAEILATGLLLLVALVIAAGAASVVYRLLRSSGPAGER
jgi:hypothetical protein